MPIKVIWIYFLIKYRFKKFKLYLRIFLESMVGRENTFPHPKRRTKQIFHTQVLNLKLSTTYKFGTLFGALLEFHTLKNQPASCYLYGFKSPQLCVITISI